MIQIAEACSFPDAVLPLAPGAGTGSELRGPLGITINGGLIARQLMTLNTTPVVNLYFDSPQHWWDGARSR
jgi:multidrug efflux pump subunit AcrB